MKGCEKKMPKKSDDFKNLRPSADEMDQPLTDHRNNLGNLGMPQHSGHKGKGHHNTSGNHKPNKNNSPHQSNSGHSFGKTGNQNRGSGTGSGRLPQSNIPHEKPSTPDLNQQRQNMDNLPKRGENPNSNRDKSDDKDHNKFDDNDKDKDLKDGSKDDNKNDDDHDLNKDNKDDKDKSDDSDKDKDKDDKDSDKDDDKSKDKDSKSDKKKDDSSKDGEKDLSKDGSSDSDKDGKDNDDQQAKGDKKDDENKSPLTKLKDFLTGKKANKGKSFSDIIKGGKKKAPPKAQQGPIHSLKDMMDRIRRIMRRIIFMIRLYLMAMRVWLAMKIVAVLQSILAMLANIINWIINVASAIWSFFAGLFTSFGALVGSTISISIIGSIVFLIATAVGAFTNMMQTKQYKEEYNRICNPSNVPTQPDDSDDGKANGSGSWKKKGTKEYQRAHSIFKSWTDLGLSGAAAAGIVGWVTHEGGDFSIIDRAEGHYGRTEKEAGISAGVVPTPSGNYSVGGGGIYQFTPYTKFPSEHEKSLGNKKWLSADKQNKFVAKKLAGGDWSTTAAYVNGTTLEEFAKSTSAPGCVLKWNAYERGATSAIAATVDGRKADAKTAYKLFNGADYKFNKKKFDSWYKPGKPGGVTTDASSTPDDPDSKVNPMCNPDANKDDDDDVSSNSLVKTAQKEVKEGKHPDGAKYCKWFGVNVGTPWCAVFVSWVLHHTKGYEYIPKNAAVAGFNSYFKGKHENRSYKATPKPGWLIMFDWDNAHNTGSGNSHIGIVTKVKNGKISTIEGNDAEGTTTVTKEIHNEYEIGDKRISMYAVPKKK